MIRKILLGICITAAACSIALMIWQKTDKRQSETQFQHLKEKAVVDADSAGKHKKPNKKSTANEISFQKLHKENPDIVAWIRFDDTDAVHIDYPILYSGDDEKYLRHDIYGNYRIAGCIFLEGENTPDFSDLHSIIYGHNMRISTMFGDLKRYKQTGFYKKNQYFTIYTPDAVYRYQIFSFHDVPADSDIYTIGYQEGNDYQDFLDGLMADSLEDTGVKVKSPARIVTLSTCSQAGSQYRFVIHAVLLS